MVNVESILEYKQLTNNLVSNGTLLSTSTSSLFCVILIQEVKAEQNHFKQCCIPQMKQTLPIVQNIFRIGQLKIDRVQTIDFVTNQWSSMH